MGAIGVLSLATTLLTAAPIQSPESAARVATRRVPISFSFSGSQVFLWGQLPPGADSVVTVMEGPRLGALRLMQKGKVVLFWMGVRQYELAHAPGLYLVNLHCPICNGQGSCEHPDRLAALNEELGSPSDRVGQDAILARTDLHVLGGEPLEGEHAEVVEGFWELQESRGLYRLRHNAIRVTDEGILYHVFNLPTEAPEGRYQIRTHFLRGDSLVAVARNDLFVRQSGLVNWLSRLAERHAVTYGGFTVAIALLAGFLAGTIFKKGGKH
jgi:hypothetical protein